MIGGAKLAEARVFAQNEKAAGVAGGFFMVRLSR
jgi:hypothetical protein